MGTSPFGVIYKTVWERPQDVTLRHPQGVIFQRPKDVGRGPALALHRGPYTNVLRTLQIA